MLRVNPCMSYFIQDNVLYRVFLKIVIRRM